jgi:hypothetical protein
VQLSISQTLAARFAKRPALPPGAAGPPAVRETACFESSESARVWPRPTAWTLPALAMTRTPESMTAARSGLARARQQIGTGGVRIDSAMTPHFGRKSTPSESTDMAGWPGRLDSQALRAAYRKACQCCRSLRVTVPGRGST